MTEKKITKPRRTPSLNAAADSKEFDQPLSSATDAPKVGKIDVPKAAQNITTANKEPRKTNPRGQQRRTRPQQNTRNTAGKAVNNNNSNNKPAVNNKAANPKPVNSSVKTEDSRKSPAKKTNRNNSANSSSNRTQKNTARKNSPRRGKVKPSIKAYFLGGLNEIGKNFTLFECQDDMFILDCGLAFPDRDMLGIDVVIPDFTFVEKNADKIRGIVITHGHEDHIGALAYLLKRINKPVYATSLTIGIISAKLKEHNLLNSAKLIVTPAGSHIQLGCMDIEFIHVNHSISDSVGIAIHSPAGVLVHTGDFKVDFTPADGEMMDLQRFAELGKAGVLALMMDSTNAIRPGHTKTEQNICQTFENLFAQAEGKRVIVATFASNIGRVQQIINCAVKHKRKIALSGRSMLNIMGIASELGYLDIPEGVLIDLNTINQYEPGQLTLITTGSQGEAMSALSRMAFSDHRQVEVGDDDFIIISAKPIPGNEKSVATVVDELMKLGCTVIYESMYDVHVSGHAYQEELKLIQALVRPKYFIPVHGEQKHLRKNVEMAVQMGMDPANTFIGDVGVCIEINQDFLKRGEDVPAGAVMVDGYGVGDVGSIVMRDRKHLGEDGIIIAVCTVDAATTQVISGPDIVSRGFVYVRESEKLIEEARKIAASELDKCSQKGIDDWNVLKQNVKDSISRFIYRKTKRSPMILPIIMEV